MREGGPLARRRLDCDAADQRQWRQYGRRMGTLRPRPVRSAHRPALGAGLPRALGHQANARKGARHHDPLRVQHRCGRPRCASQVPARVQPARAPPRQGQQHTLELRLRPDGVLSRAAARSAALRREPRAQGGRRVQRAPDGSRRLAHQPGGQRDAAAVCGLDAAPPGTSRRPAPGCTCAVARLGPLLCTAPLTALRAAHCAGQQGVSDAAPRTADDVRLDRGHGPSLGAHIVLPW
eukprot:2965330-Prymnesium_polylepis.1